ncbi:hypothetical protein [Cellvibrio sp. QJXJ]|uniref:hypothetical protein n=1 Tax=Cellvibrio sp. QJXJ TaxID=2964606 RepID=UPI0021C34584|nr:hypothetical protein [Cellvibrio sp. QJXJ]UUA72274.1 hypothetical protein NNX04_17880 [Cellvibrio sp. QJXJ]
MRSDFLVGSDKPVFKTPFFRLALFVPIILGGSLACYIGKAESLVFSLSSGVKSVELFWEYLKIPIAIASLSIPLASWVIANHRSAQLVETIKKQEEKRLYDLYYDHSDYFAKTFGRFIKTHKWFYLEAEDVPVIHRQLFLQSLLNNSGEFTPNPVVLESIKLYLRNITESLDLFIDHFESLQLAENGYELSCHSYRFCVFTRERLMTLVKNLGSRPVCPNESLQVSLSAIIEIYSLYKWVVPEYEKENDLVAVDENKIKTAIKLIMDHSGIANPEELTLSNLEGSLII